MCTSKVERETTSLNPLKAGHDSNTKEEDGKKGGFESLNPLKAGHDSNSRDCHCLRMNILYYAFAEKQAELLKKVKKTEKQVFFCDF